MPPGLSELAGRFDHTALAPEVTEHDIARLCTEALRLGVFGVCVNPFWVATASSLLKSSPIAVVSVVGFPLGANRTDVKIHEASRAVADGAREIDLVANIGLLMARDITAVEEEIAKVRQSMSEDVVLKVIIEAGRLDRQRQTEACRAVIGAGAEFVKTGTGFFGPVTVAQVETLSSAAQGRIGIKAAGGIRSLQQCRALLEAGATRLGSSSTADILSSIPGTNDAP